jgi:phosphatidylglycerophosphate synthase
MRVQLPGWVPRGYDPLVTPLLRLIFRHWRHEDGTYEPWVGRVPNQLVWYRVYCSIPFVAMLGAGWYLENGRLATISLILVATLPITDAADGALARETGNVTDTGARWDPIGDKVFGFSMVLALLWLVWIKYALVFGAVLIMALIAARAIIDVVLSVLAWLEERRGLHPEASISGKYKVNFDVGWMNLVLWNVWFHHPPDLNRWQDFLLVISIAAILGLWSLADHVRNLWRGRAKV